MEDMEYEYILRKIYKCERGGAPGADANYYRNMEHAQRAYELDVENIQNKTMRLSNKSIEDLKYEYLKECRKVWSYLTDAVKKAIENYNFAEDDIAVLKKATNQHVHVDKDSIDELVDLAEGILAKYDLDSF